MVQNVVTVICAFGISFITGSWKMCVVLVGILPICVLASFMQMKALRQNTDKSQDDVAKVRRRTLLRRLLLLLLLRASVDDTTTTITSTTSTTTTTYHNVITTSFFPPSLPPSLPVFLYGMVGGYHRRASHQWYPYGNGLWDEQPTDGLVLP